MLETVKTQNGYVKGYPGNNQFISVFKGIPFAKPPVGNLRWKAAQKVEDWDEALNCYEYQKIAWQPRFSSEGGAIAAKEFYVRGYEMSEDCLYLNIFTPAKTQDEKLPVVIYVHGGAYETGYSYLNAYDGEGFAKNGIVYVSISYRLNVFGFLATSDSRDEYAAGNYGLTDQIEALHWVKENIRYFGGDEQNITVMGQSAGGSSVENLIHCPLSKGMIKRAIMQSGGGINKKGALDSPNMDEAAKNGDEFLKFMGVKSLSEAKKLDASFINEKYCEFRKISDKIPLFIPVVDNNLLEETSAQYFTSGKHFDMEILLGSTADEFRQKRSLSDEEKIKIIKNRFGDEYAKKCIEFLSKDNRLDDVYFENIIGDEMTASGLAFAENEVRLGRKPTFVYYFKYVPPGAESMGAHHSVEHQYVFQTLNRSYRKYRAKDYEKSLILSKAWANFIKTGNPSCEEVQWLPYESGFNNVLIIDEEIKTGQLKVRKNVEFLVDYILDKI